MADAPSPPHDGPWRVATRRSALAQAQAQQVADAVAEATGRPAELVPMATTGDEHPERAIESFDAKGLFVDRTRQAVLAGDCHFVVHSYKDLPTGSSEGLVIGAVPRRADPRDALITRDGLRLADLPRDRVVTVGTSSIRRRAQLLRARRDLVVQPLRGNLDTRLRRVADGHMDAVVVAMAGLLRMGGSDLPLKAAPLEPGECLQAPAQGALAIECRPDDEQTRAALQHIDDLETRRCVAAERAFLATLQGGCTAPIGASARMIPGDDPDQPRLELLGMISDPSGTRMFRASHIGTVKAPGQLGRTLAETMTTEAPEIVERMRGA